MHVLLIAALCFGQLAASVHLAGHFHHHEDGINAAYTINWQQINLSDPIGVNDENCEDERAEADCGIYHAYLGLSGVLDSGAPEFCTRLDESRHCNYSYVQVAGTAAHSRYIRGPPVAS